MTKPETKFKRLVRQKLGVKRVTKQAQIALWKKLSNTNKKQFGSWKPQGVVSHRAPPSPTPTPKDSIDRYLISAYTRNGGTMTSYANLLKFWMTHYTTAQKKAIYTKVSDPESAKKNYPLCK